MGNTPLPLQAPRNKTICQCLHRLSSKLPLEEAERFYREAISRWELTHGGEHPREAQILGEYAKLLKKTGRKREAKQYEARAAAILARSQSATELRSRVDVQDPRLRAAK